VICSLNSPPNMFIS